MGNNMELVDYNNVEGVIEIWQSEDNKNWEKVSEFKNLRTLVGKENEAELLLNIATGYSIGYWSVGSGSSVADETATVVEGEYDSFAIDTQAGAFDGSLYVITNTMNLNPTEGNGTIRKIALLGFGPTTTLVNRNPADPDESTHEWKLLHYADVLLPTGKVKTSALNLKFVWRLKFS